MTRFAVCGLGLVLVGCKPTISAFRAEPNVSCVGGPVRLSWSASSSGRLLSTPPDSNLGTVEANGSTAIAPRVNTRYRFVSENLWGQAMRDADVEVRAAPSGSQQIGASVADPSATCEGDMLALTVTAPERDWSAQIRVSSVQLPANIARRYHVEHAGAKADLDPGIASHVFDGMPVQGEWRISTPLQAGEACGKKLPRSLSLLVNSTCSR